MQARMAGRRSLERLHQDQQLLTPGGEIPILDSIERMYSWGRPYRVSQVIHLATEILMKRTLAPPFIGVNWVSRFLLRHPSLKSRFSTPKDRERIVAEDVGVFRKWFDLFIGQVNKYKIKPRNIYNMDEKGYAMGMIGKARVIVSQHDRVAYMMQEGSREWVTLLECVTMDGDMLGVQFIFKGKLKMKEWARHLRHIDMDIEVSESGSTDNEIGLTWFKKIIEPQSKRRLESEDEYRLLFLDGHSSHISREVALFL